MSRLLIFYSSFEMISFGFYDFMYLDISDIFMLHIETTVFLKLEGSSLATESFFKLAHGLF